MKGNRKTIYLKGNIHAQAKALKINVSRVCAQALMKEAQRLAKAETRKPLA